MTILTNIFFCDRIKKKGLENSFRTEPPMPTINTTKIRTKNKNLFLRVSKGHFATSHSHINYYIDVTTQKARLSEAQAVAKELVSYYSSNTIVDAILCLDGTQVIGTLLAEELTNGNFTNLNAHQTIYIVTPENTSGSQLFFRDNIVPMIAGYLFAKYVLKLSLLNNLGSLTGAMTSTPALGTLIGVAKTDDVASAYAATYPIALIAVVLVSQFIVILF